MEPLPYTDSGAKIVFYVLLAAFFALEWRARVRSRLVAREAPAERLSFVAVVGSVALGVGGGFLAAAKLESAAIGQARWELFGLGALAMVAGIVVRQWAIAVLGKSFTVEVRVHPGQRIVESGPYRYLAHPSYTGMILSFLGIGLMLGNWVSLAALALLPTAGIFFRIRTEERVLLAGLGEPYRRFLATRARLVPGLW